MKALLQSLMSGKTLSRAEAAFALDLMLEGKEAPECIGAFLAILRLRKETPAEIAGFGGAVLRARLEPVATLPAGLYVAFAGIGKPSRFFDSLQKQPGVELSDGVPFPDHHAFRPSDLSFLTKLAGERRARLVTTDKDHVRLPPEMRDKVMRASVRAKFEDEAALARLLDGVSA